MGSGHNLEDSGLLLKGVTETVQHEENEQRGGFLSMLLGTLGAILLGNVLIGWEAIAKRQDRGKGRGINRAGQGALIAGYGSRSTKMDC